MSAKEPRRVARPVGEVGAALLEVAAGVRHPRHWRAAAQLGDRRQQRVDVRLLVLAEGAEVGMLRQSR